LVGSTPSTSTKVQSAGQIFGRFLEKPHVSLLRRPFEAALAQRFELPRSRRPGGSQLLSGDCALDGFGHTRRTVGSGGSAVGSAWLRHRPLPLRNHEHPLSHDSAVAGGIGNPGDRQYTRCFGVPPHEPRLRPSARSAARISRSDRTRWPSRSKPTATWAAATSWTKEAGLGSRTPSSSRQTARRAATLSPPVPCRPISPPAPSAPPRSAPRSPYLKVPLADPVCPLSSHLHRRRSDPRLRYRSHLASPTTSPDDAADHRRSPNGECVWSSASKGRDLALGGEVLRSRLLEGCLEQCLQLGPASSARFNAHGRVEGRGPGASY